MARLPKIVEGAFVKHLVLSDDIIRHSYTHHYCLVTISLASRDHELPPAIMQWQLQICRGRKSKF